MIRAILLIALAYSASAGLIAAPAVSYASGPAIGATLVGKVTVNAPEVTVVKQPIIVDQPQIRYHSVPSVVGYPAPQVAYVAAQPAVLAHHQTVAALPVTHHHTVLV